VDHVDPGLSLNTFVLLFGQVTSATLGDPVILRALGVLFSNQFFDIAVGDHLEVGHEFRHRNLTRSIEINRFEDLL
jgi:hypothetical protein